MDRNISAVARLLLLLALLGVLVACTNKAMTVEVQPHAEVKVQLINAEGESTGSALLTQLVHGVIIRIDAKKLTPGIHAFHVHETGRCIAPDFQSAGGHFNPTAKEHGFDNPKGYHDGDLPNLIVGEDGRGTAELFVPQISLLQGKSNSLLKAGGTALVIHGGADDYITNPAGAAGDRVACGVIE